jgi:drug/metabolite transporter (DMT)-like permease
MHRSITNTATIATTASEPRLGFLGQLGSAQVGVVQAFVCLFLLGLLPILSNGRPAGSAALTFAAWLSVWQLLFSLPMLFREWRSGRRGAFGSGQSPPARRRTVAITIFTGALFAFSTWGYVLSFEKVGAVNAAIALQAYPIFAAALEAFWLGRRKTPAEAFFTLLILAALYYLATGGSWRPEGLSPYFAVALAVPALWSVAHLILRQALVETPITPNQVTTSRLAVCSAVLLPLALFIEGPQAVLAAAASPAFQASAVFMGFVYYVELIFWFNALQRIDVSVVSAISVPAPAVTMVLAAVFLGESIAAWQVAALAVVAIGLYCLLRAGRERSPEAVIPAGSAGVPPASSAI